MKITLSRGATLNLGNYESSRLDLSIEATVDSLEAAGMSEALTNADRWLVVELTKRLKAIQTEAGMPPQPVTRFTGKLPI